MGVFPVAQESTNTFPSSPVPKDYAWDALHRLGAYCKNSDVKLFEALKFGTTD